MNPYKRYRCDRCHKRILLADAVVAVLYFDDGETEIRQENAPDEAAGVVIRTHRHCGYTIPIDGRFKTQKSRWDTD